MSDKSTRWYKNFFDDDLGEILENHRSPKELSAIADFIIVSLGLKSGDSVYDQCCGTGTISRALAEKNITVIGVDQAEHYISRAKELATKNNLKNVFFETADAFKYKTPKPCRGAFNWWSSFGFLEKDEDNIQMLHRMRESLQVGGRIVFDYMNSEHIRANFKPLIERSREIFGQTVKVVKHSKIEGDMIYGRWVYTPEKGEPRELHDQARLYTPNDFKNLLTQAGFGDIKFKSNIQGDAYHEDSDRCIILASVPMI